ncbi:Dynein axonemal heavy chain 12, partial [Pseudolycoriella hygida]
NQVKLEKLQIPHDYLDLLPVPQTKIIAAVRRHVAKAPIPSMTKKTESRILRWVQLHFKRKYSSYVKSYIDDLRTEYDEVVKEFSLHKMLTYDDDYFTKSPKFKFKFLGKTKNYDKFKRNRDKVKQKLYITLPFIRCILNYSQVDFPDILNDYSSYNHDTKGNSVYLTPNEFKARVAEDLVNQTLFLKNAWYPKIVNVFKKNIRKYHFTPNVWYKIFDCAHGLINQQLNDIKIRTFEHIFDILLDRSRTPRFQLQLDCNGKNIDIFPQYSEINMLFTKILEDISNVGNKLIPLDQIIKIGKELPAPKSEYIPITIGESYMKEMHERLNRSLLEAYTPILVYLDEFRHKYLDLYGDETQIQIEQFLSVPQEITVYLSEIKVFQDYISQLRREPVNEHFIIVIINQTKALAGLRYIATEYIDLITSKIVAEHTLECKNICKFFEDVEMRSKQIPTTTEQLLDGGEFMTQVKTVHMKEMQVRIEENIRVNGLLVDLTQLSQYHFDLQQRTINLFNEMYNVFEENAAFFETYKIQFEEHLQAVTRKLNEDMENLIPSISIINEMSETEKLGEYQIILKNFIENLKCFDDYIVWINKEEKLFKLPVSKYEMLEQIKNFIFPFDNLIRLCIRWLRYYYIWMDGPFEYLVPQFVESTVEDFLKEFLAIQKYYRNRIKQDMVGNPICKFKVSF